MVTISVPVRFWVWFWILRKFPDGVPETSSSIKWGGQTDGRTSSKHNESHVCDTGAAWKSVCMRHCDTGWGRVWMGVGRCAAVFLLILTAVSGQVYNTPIAAMCQIKSWRRCSQRIYKSRFFHHQRHIYWSSTGGGLHWFTDGEFSKLNQTHSFRINLHEFTILTIFTALLRNKLYY